MRFTIAKAKFEKALNIASHAIGSRSANPFLMCFKLEVSAKGLEITSSNNDISIWTLIPIEENGGENIRSVIPGATLLDAKILSEIVHKFEGNEVSVDVVDDAIAKIDDGRAVFKLNCVKAEEYPDIDMERSGNSFTLDSAGLIQLVDQTAFAALDKDTRPILTAINLKAEAGKLIATATDSARLSRKSTEVDSTLRFIANIPAKTLEDIVKLLDGVKSVEISASSEKAVFSFANTLISCRLIAGEYPVSNSIIPQNFSYFLEVNSQQLLNAIDRASILSTDRAPVVKLTMSEEKVEISSSSDQNGSAAEQLTTLQYSGERLEIAFNASFVSQAVRALGSEDVTMSFLGEMKPFVIKNPKDDSIVELITPMRTR